MRNVGVTFEILDESQPLPIGWSKESGHLVFDIKMDFSRKARWVLDGHKTSDPEGSTYAGVVSRESVRIAFTYAALNDIDIFAADIQNAYLQSPLLQKHYVICGDGSGNPFRQTFRRTVLFVSEPVCRHSPNQIPLHK